MLWCSGFASCVGCVCGLIWHRWVGLRCCGSLVLVCECRPLRVCVVWLICSCFAGLVWCGGLGRRFGVRLVSWFLVV